MTWFVFVSKGIVFAVGPFLFQFTHTEKSDSLAPDNVNSHTKITLLVACFVWEFALPDARLTAAGNVLKYFFFVCSKLNTLSINCVSTLTQNYRAGSLCFVIRETKIFLNIFVKIKILHTLQKKPSPALLYTTLYVCTFVQKCISSLRDFIYFIVE